VSFENSENASLDKRVHGQFFTTTNPFNVNPFHRWLKGIRGYKKESVIEPFAGANNIVCMLSDLGYELNWECFDIHPVNDDSNASGLTVRKADTLKNFPTGYAIAITNPPYLASYSAKRLGLPFPLISHDNVYKEALDVMLQNTPYVAAIIPESFITQNLFHSRLQSVISLRSRMFEDTEMPVCLALFVPTYKMAVANTFDIFAENRLLGDYLELRAALDPFKGQGLPWKFNDPAGGIGLRAIDTQKGPTIEFVPGEEITAEIVVSSRLVTRIGGPDLSAKETDKIVTHANAILNDRRRKTKDTFMTAFKGLREDGCYRRRLDYAQARDLLNLAAERVGVL
jgi:hypothetical protein